MLYNMPKNPRYAANPDMQSGAYVRHGSNATIEIGPSPLLTPQKRLPNKLAPNHREGFDSFNNAIFETVKIGGGF